MNKIKIKIELFSEKHIDDIASLEKICFSTPWSKNLLASEIYNNNSNFLVAVDEFNKVLGYVGLKFILDEGYITNIAVFPQYRNNGVASELLKRTIEFGYAKNLKFISLEVRKSNVYAISIYKNLGFALIGERKNFYIDPQENAFIMTKYLK